MEYSVLKAMFIICVTLTEPSYEFTLPLYDMTQTQNSTTPRFQNISGPEEGEQICPVYCPQDKIKDRKHCIPCDCTDSCLTDSTCCEEAKLQSAKIDVDKICVKTGVDKIVTTAYIESYLLVQQCSNKTNQTISNDVIAKCHQPDENEINEMVPIYSSKSGTNYRNAFCAMCNDDSGSILPWETKIACDFYLSRFDMTLEGSINKTLLQAVRGTVGCELQWRPVNDKARRCFYHDDIISQCNDTYYYGPQLEELCRQSFSPVKGFSGVYKNEFCLRCAENETEFVQVPFQTLPTFSARIGTDHYIGKYDNQQDKSLENEKMTSSLDGQEESSFFCPERMTYDYILKRCICKSCAITELKVGGICLPFMQTIVGISLDYRFKLLYRTDDFTWLLPKDQIFAEVRHLVLHNQSSTTCAENVLNTEVGDDYVILRIQLTKWRDYQPIDIYEDFQIVQQKVEKINKLAAQGVYAYTVEIDDSPFEPVYNNIENLGVYKNDLDHFRNCMTTIAISKMQFCNTIVVTNYELLEGDIVLVDNYIRFSPGEYFLFKNSENITGIYICYDLFASRGIDLSFADGPIESNATEVHNLFSVWICFIYIISFV